MKKVLVIGLLAVVLFGLSAGGSFLLQRLKTEKPRTTGDDTSSTAEQTPRDKERGPEPRTTSTGRDSDSGRPGLIGRREYNPEADATVQQAARLREQQDDLRRREEAFKARVKNLELIAQDIRTGREEMDKLRRDITDEKKTADELLAALERDLRQLEEKKRQVEADRREHEKKITEIDATRMGNIKRVSSVSETMEPDKAAAIIMTMADAGNLDGAAALLSNMKERKAADVLSQIPDKALAAQLFEKMMSLKQVNGSAPGAGAPRTSR